MNMRIKLLTIITLFGLLRLSCSLQDPKPREIRGHEDVRGGVSHALAASHAERYCQYCHGVKLVGGANGEPSCYACHGRNWIASEPEQLFAPQDHTLEKNGYWHQSEITQIESICINCHGADFKGDLNRSTPSCLVCHEKNW